MPGLRRVACEKLIEGEKDTLKLGRAEMR